MIFRMKQDIFVLESLGLVLIPAYSSYERCLY